MKHITIESIRGLLDAPDQPRYLRSFNKDEVLELLALYYLGRGSGRTFAAGLKDAKKIATALQGQQLEQKVPLNNVIIKGLAKLGLKLD